MQHLKPFLAALLILFSFNVSKAQILHTESFTVILDSTKRVQGSIVPDLKFKNLKENLFEFENTADLSIKFKKNAVTFANKIELSRFGNQTLLSGGYVYAEYRKITETKIAIEVYNQVHWAEARGMEWKYAGGVNLRLRMVTKPNIGFYLGIGPFYENERWNYKGVSDDVSIPVGPVPIINENIKLGSYASLKYAPFEKIFVDISLYHQARFDELFSSPRLASSSRVTYKFTEVLGLSFIYQNIYDPNPVVPIDKLFNNVTLGVTISF
ncbi:hypothetical protein [Algoriphagus aquimarinus]|uniref:DUF481 domain-containing protein n=1 Tax=Algoriphagus aquimarinus TaxID=237018 RepID=A0A1I1A177_9BACT|nr:hypothetical protein [Algoriphagus aquimarinus]SFB31681.1 hypothetical protein SAMN04489723_107102 [Algoriphagus aquimarinus]